MSGNSINFNDKKIKKVTFKKQKKYVIQRILMLVKYQSLKKDTYGKYNLFIYFIGHNDNDVIRSLYLGLSQMTGYINRFDKNKIT